MNCKICNKKLDLAQQIIGKCRCQLIFCSTHRFPKEHSCTIDIVALNTEKLKKQNPAVVAPKFLKI